MTTSSRSRHVAVYIVGRGEILKTLGGSEAFVALNTPEGCAVLDAPLGLNEHLVMVDESGPEPVLVDRPTFGLILPEAVDLGEVVALAVPAGAALVIAGEPAGEADEAGLEIEFASPGRYWVQVELWPYVPLRARVMVD